MRHFFKNIMAQVFNCARGQQKTLVTLE